MATFTAQILVGSGHRFHGGITPTHVLYLSENDRPAWILTEAGLRDETDGPRVVWIPSVDHMLEDGLALVATHAIHSGGVRDALGETAHLTGEPLVLHEVLPPDGLAAVRRAVREAKTNGVKLILTVLEESTVMSQLDVLENYPFEHVVCIPRGGRP